MIINESFPPRRCPNCQREVASNLQFCPTCGATLFQERKPWPVLMIVAFLFFPAAVFGACTVFQYDGLKDANFHDEQGIGGGLIAINVIGCLACLIAGIVMLSKRSRK